MEVERVNTPLSMEEVKKHLSEAFFNTTGRRIGKILPYLMAMIALENRHGKAIYNHNFGNVIATSSSDNYFKHDGNPLKFISIPSYYEGAIHFLKTLSSTTNKRILEAADNDDFGGFFQSIHDRHPTTHKAYNLVTDPEIRASLRNTYLSLVNSFKGLEPITVNTSTSKVISKKSNSNFGGFLVIAMITGSAVYFAKKRKLI